MQASLRGRAIHFRCPDEKLQQAAALFDKKSKERTSIDVVSMQAGVGLDAPADVFTLPGPEVVTTGSIPKKGKSGEHAEHLAAMVPDRKTVFL